MRLVHVNLMFGVKLRMQGFVLQWNLMDCAAPVKVAHAGLPSSSSSGEIHSDAVSECETSLNSSVESTGGSSETVVTTSFRDFKEISALVEQVIKKQEALQQQSAERLTLIR